MVRPRCIDGLLLERCSRCGELKTDLFSIFYFPFFICHLKRNRSKANGQGEDNSK